jgi:hypothetical protein
MPKRLQDIAVNDANRLAGVAVMRLTLRVFAETHRILYEYQRWLTDLVRSSADENGNADGPSLAGARGVVESRWKAAMAQWLNLLSAARDNAAGIAFGVLWVQHNHFMAKARRLQEDMTAAQLDSVVRAWTHRRQVTLQAAAQRTHADRLNLSQRVWQLDHGGLRTIQNTMNMAFTEGTNAFDLAQLLEARLGADQDVTRWAYDRLYNMTSAERSVSKEGLLVGRGQGVAYNALRMARTEIQYANHDMSTAIVAHAPWVTGRYVRLSPAHPKSDICDEYAAGGPYPKDQQILPLHSNCLCHYEDALASAGDFTDQVRGWINGSNDYLDDYSSWADMQQPTEPLPTQMPLADLLEEWLALGKTDHAAALQL